MERTIVRCKHRKLPPGDGGVVDGCGWQGPRQSANKCPECSSPILYVVRNQMDREAMAKRLEEVIKAAADFIEVADVPSHLRNEEVYKKRRAALNTVASLRLSELLPDEDAYLGLARAAREYVKLLAEAKVELTSDSPAQQGRLRSAFAELETHLTKALGKSE